MVRKICLETVRIESDRLLLVPITYDYMDSIYEEFTPEITKYMVPRSASSIDDTRAFIASSLDGLRRNENLQLVILKKEDHEFLGCIGFHHADSDVPEVGIWIKKSAHGRKYGLEAGTALIGWTRSHLQFQHLVYPVDRRNLGSRRIAEENQGRIMREFKKVNLSGFELDEVEYWIDPKN